MPKSFEKLAIFPGSELELIRAFMSHEGVAESRWLFASGLNLESALSGSAISLHQFDVIYRNVYRIAERPSLGIDFGIALNLSRWGMLSSALLCANTLGHALSIADEFREVLRSRFDMRNQVKANQLVVDLTPKSGLSFPVNEVFAYEVLLGTLKTQISQLIAKPFRFSEVKVPYQAPINVKYYQKISETPVQFGAVSGQFSIPLNLINKTLPLTNRVTRKLVIEQCREELERVKTARSGDLVFTIRSLLAKREGGLPDLTAMASELSMSPRTLRRHLQQEGLQYRQLCEQQRQQLAISLLNSGAFSVREVGERCGFKDNANFHKAFKRWTGETPAQYRQKTKTIM